MSMMMESSLSGSSEERADDEVLQLLWKLKDVKQGVSVKDRKKSLKLYKKCFIGKEMVDWLISKGESMNRKEAVQIGELLLKKNHIEYAGSKKMDFRDAENCFYRFVEEKVENVHEDEENKVKYRVVLLGGERSGKSALAEKFCRGKFEEDYTATGHEDYRRREDFVIQNTKRTIETLDTGSILVNEFETKLAKWNEWATGFILVFGINSKASFETIPKLFNTLIKTRQFRVTPVILVGAKSDLESERKVSKDEALSFAHRYRCHFIEVSSKTGENVEEAFIRMVAEIDKINYLQGPAQHKTGWMNMKKKGSQFKKRYLLMTDSGLRIYSKEPQSQNDTSSLKYIIPMQNCVVDIVAISKERSFESQKGSPRDSPIISRRESDSSDEKLPKSNSSSSSPIISPVSPEEVAHKLLTRKNSVPKDSKLRIFILDTNDQEWEILTNSMEELGSWYESLLRCVNKATSQMQRIGEGDDAEGENEKTDFSSLSDEEVLDRAITAFNKKPKRGLEILYQLNKLEKNPQSVAKFLISQKALKKAAIGEYIGGSDAFQVSVLKEYLNLIEFAQIPFDEALRMFLTKFTLPKEAQQIDRIMEHFAGRYCKCNQGEFENQDVGYILAFSLIMLNTDAHNANIPKDRKMTKLQFVANNRGINNGKDLAKEYLEQLYDKIVSTPFEMSHEREDFHQWDKQGWLQVKESKKENSFNLGTKKKGSGRKLWCIISASCLYLFEQPTDKKPFHIIPLHNLEIDSLMESGGDINCFVVYNPDPKMGIRSAVDSKEVQLRELAFFTETRKEKMEWMLMFKLNSVSAPTYKT